MQSMGALKSKSSIFIERWSKAEHMNIKLGAALITLSVVSVSLTIALVCIVFKPKSVYFISDAGQAGVAVSGRMPQATVAVFTSSWVLNWSNFTPATVNYVYTRAQHFMSPNLFSQTQARLSKDIDEVKKNNISTLFSITKDPVVSPDQRGFSVTLQGSKALFEDPAEMHLS